MERQLATMVKVPETLDAERAQTHQHRLTRQPLGLIPWQLEAAQQPLAPRGVLT